jgi:hypothetical protein
VRLIKTFGLAAVAALAAMAFLGAGSASATVTALCKSSETECQAANHYPKGTTIKANSSEVRFENSGKPEFICSRSEMELKLTATTGTPLPVEFNIMSFSGCESTIYKGLTCAMAVQKLPPSGGIEWTAGSNGTLSFGFPESVVECSGQVIYRCFFSPKSTVKFGFQGTGPEGQQATLVATEQELLTSPKIISNCKQLFGTEKPKFTATYTIEDPQPVYVAQGYTG